MFKNKEAYVAVSLVKVKTYGSKEEVFNCLVETPKEVLVPVDDEAEKDCPKEVLLDLHVVLNKDIVHMLEEQGIEVDNDNMPLPENLPRKEQVKKLNGRIGDSRV